MDRELVNSLAFCQGWACRQRRSPHSGHRRRVDSEKQCCRSCPEGRLRRLRQSVDGLRFETLQSSNVFSHSFLLTVSLLMDWCYKHTRRHSAEGSLRDGETYCYRDETRVRGGNHRVRHGKTSLLRGNECVRDGNECFDEGDNGVRLDEGLIRGAQSSVRGGNDFFRLSKNHFRVEQNHFRHGNNCRWRRSRHALDSSGFACEWR